MMFYIAVEVRCFGLSACQFLRRSQCPEDYHAIQGNEPDTILIAGGSVIVSPLGDILKGPLRGEEGLLVAEFDEKDVIRGKYDLDVVGHYSRPDVFHLSVDEAPKATVTYAVRATASKSRKNEHDRTDHSATSSRTSKKYG
jgi:nitrilase